MKNNMMNMALNRLFHIEMIRRERIKKVLDVITKNGLDMMKFCTKHYKTGEDRRNYRLSVRLDNSLYVTKALYMHKENNRWRIYLKNNDFSFITKMVNTDVAIVFDRENIDSLYDFRLHEKFRLYLESLPTENARTLVFFTCQYKTPSEMIELYKIDYLSKEYLAFSLLIIDKKIKEISEKYI